MIEIDSVEKAVTLALALAVTAPDEEKAKMATKMAEELAVGLDELTVERCKRDALRLVEEWDS